MKSKKLKLKKETISNLQNESLRGVKGGLINTNGAQNNHGQVNFFTIDSICSIKCSGWEACGKYQTMLKKNCYSNDCHSCAPGVENSRCA